MPCRLIAFMLSVRATLAWAGLALLSCQVAWAQSADGVLLGRTSAGAQVTITNLETGSTRTVRADPDGAFSFGRLQPGPYRVSAGGATREVSIVIGSGTSVSLLEAERVEVAGRRARASIDLSTVESNTVFTQSQLLTLPVPRSVDAVVLLAPGTVKGDDLGRGLTLPSFGGASIAENAYYINGMDVTNIRDFLSYARLPFSAIGQVQAKTGGYGAEYGRSLGGVVSIVTNRGTNDWKGGVSVDWSPARAQARGPDVMDRDPDRTGLPYVFNSANYADSRSAVLQAGGPIVRDRLFVYGVLNAPMTSNHLFAQSFSVRTDQARPNGLLKLDWALSDKHQFEATLIENGTRSTYREYRSASPYSTTHDGNASVSTRTREGRVSIGRYTGHLSSALSVSALLGEVIDKAPKSSVDPSLGRDCPVALEVDGGRIGCWSSFFVRDAAAPDDKDARSAFRLDVDYTLGAHRLRAGIDNQVFRSWQAGEAYSGGYVFVYDRVGASGLINGAPGFKPDSEYVTVYEYRTTSGMYEVRNSALYIEDSWSITKRLLLYGGLRWESFDNRNSQGVSFVARKNLLAPRTGFAWDPAGDSSTKVFGTFGRYYIPVPSNTNIRFTRGEFSSARYFVHAGRDPRTQAPLGVDLAAPGIGSPQVFSNGVPPDPSYYADTQLKPMNQDEWIVGMQRALRKDLVIGAKIVHRKINSGMDDYCDRQTVADWITRNVDPGYVDNLATCLLMNPGRDLNLRVDLRGDGTLTDVRLPGRALGLAAYSRLYSALELTVERPFDGRWSLQGSYTYSKSRGTAEGYVNSQLNQGDSGATQDFDFGSLTQGAYGYLPNDRRHSLKLFGSIQASASFRLGFDVAITSGRPLSCVGFVPPTAPDFTLAGQYYFASAFYCIRDPAKPAVLVPRGTVGRTPWTGSLGLSMAYEPSWARKNLAVQIDVTNVLNSRRPLELNEVRDYSREASNGAPPYQVNQNYLQPVAFQQPRSVRLNVRYTF